MCKNYQVDYIYTLVRQLRQKAEQVLLIALQKTNILVHTLIIFPSYMHFLYC